MLCKIRKPEEGVPGDRRRPVPPAEDVLDAVRWVRKHGSEYGLDPERISLMGKVNTSFSDPGSASYSSAANFNPTLPVYFLNPDGSIDYDTNFQRAAATTSSRAPAPRPTRCSTGPR